MLFESIFALAALAAPTMALSGQATTTRYYDGQEGACGCGSNNALFSWQTGIGNDVYTAAASQAIFDESGSSWCGSGCGQCFELTSTGNAPSGQGAGGAAGQSIIIMVTNLCPNAGNAQWCPQPGAQNDYGFSYHFDLMASSSSLGEVLGDNPIVNFNSTTCPGAAASDFATCQCASQSNTGSTNQAPAPAPSPSAASAPASGSGSSSGSSSSAAGTAAHWAQCGGTGFTGATECESGFSCQVQNPYYSQCL